MIDINRISIFFAIAVTFSCEMQNSNSSLINKNNASNVVCNFKSKTNNKRVNGDFQAMHTSTPVIIDGLCDDETWSNMDWNDLNYAWMGPDVDSMDYYGKFKLAWDSQHLYILVSIIDDSISPTLSSGIENYCMRLGRSIYR